MPSSELHDSRSRLGNEKGVALVVVGLLLVLFVSMVGMAVDMGRGYLVRNALGSAVDGAALAAARAIPQGNGAALAAANKIFNANFPAGFLGVTAVTNPPTVSFTVAGDGSNMITVSSNATLPTTFMRIGGFQTLSIGSSGQATRRLVDMAFVIDRSGSLNGVFNQVKTASSNFIGQFDSTLDRVALMSFSTNTVVQSAIRTPGRGFNKGTLQGQVAALASGGSTATAEGLYQAWNQLNLIPINNQSGLRVIVLFTDGAPNSFATSFVPANGSYVTHTCNSTPPYAPPVGAAHDPAVGTLICGDPTPGSSTSVQGLWDTNNNGSNVRIGPTSGNGWQSNPSTNYTVQDLCIPFIPPASIHTPQQGNSGIPTTFPLFDGTVPGQLALINPNGINFVNHVQNANNAARNLAAIIADRIRSDTTGAARIHIFALGLGNLLEVGTGSDLEHGSSMLRRIANDPASPNYNANQPEGGYFFAGSAGELTAAFNAIRDRIIRISQ